MSLCIIIFSGFTIKLRYIIPRPSLRTKYTMGNHVIPEGTFYTFSPQIKIKCKKDQDEIVLAALQKEEAETNKGGEMHCFLRPPSNKERDEHLARLQGAERMNSFLSQMDGSARVYFHGFVGFPP